MCILRSSLKNNITFTEEEENYQVGVIEFSSIKLNLETLNLAATIVFPMIQSEYDQVTVMKYKWEDKK